MAAVDLDAPRVDADLRERYERLERTAEVRARQLEAVAEIARAATSSLDLDFVLRKSVDVIRERLGFYHVSAFLRDPATGEMLLRQATAGAGYALIAQDYQLKVDGESLLAAALRTGRPSLVQDVTTVPGFVPNPLLPETRAECVLPLFTGQEAAGAVGALELKSVEPGAFQPETVVVLQSVAALVAVAIQHVRLYESEFSRRLLAETLQEAGQLVGSTLNLDEVLRRLLGQLSRAVPYDRAAVLLENEEALEVAATAGAEEPGQGPGARTPVTADDLYSRVRQTRKLVSLADVAREPAAPRPQWLPANRYWVGAPLIVQDEVIGLVSVARDRVGDYTPEEAQAVFSFANQAAVAIHNARLYDQVTRFNQALEQSVAVRTAELSARTAELEHAYQRLEKLDRNKSDFINLAAHELRTPLTVLQGYVSLLRAEPVMAANPQLADVITGMLNGAGRLHEIINRMLEAARVDSRVLDLRPRPMRLAALARRLRLEMKATLMTRTLNFAVDDLDDLPDLVADDELLLKVFLNLATNAVKFTPDGGAITVTGCVRAEGPNRWVDVMVRDTGIGIAPENHEVIFEKFYQTGPLALHSSGRTNFKAGGAGLGLAIASSIVQAHNGRIWVESPGHDEAACPGSCFHVLLPVPEAEAG
jgi:signal transduction histidine kinase